MSAERKHNRLAILLVAVWVVFTVTLAAWWLIFGLRQLDLINQSNLENAVQLNRHYQMLLWEGGILIASLIGGGLALFYYARREQKRHAQVEEFFAAFTHDAKTALASLRLQAESLQEDYAGTGPNPLLDRLLRDTLRLQLQLENSLFLVNLTRGKFFLEAISLGSSIDNLRRHWPDLTIRQNGDAIVLADARALESVLTNLIQNAVTHGQATEIDIKIEATGGRAQIRIGDNGRGFSGDYDQLGKLFVRHGRGSGSGVGIYIVRQLVKRMNGSVEFGGGAGSGFVAEFDLPEGVGTHASGVLTSGNQHTEQQHAGGVRTSAYRL
jgi:signal transduction histidine kinase